jgi:hypothetical protein
LAGDLVSRNITAAQPEPIDESKRGLTSMNIAKNNITRAGVQHIVFGSMVEAERNHHVAHGGKPEVIDDDSDLGHSESTLATSLKPKVHTQTQHTHTQHTHKLY